MSLYQKVIMDLKELNQVKELYRFQGANSFDHFDFHTSFYFFLLITHF